MKLQLTLITLMAAAALPASAAVHQGLWELGIAGSYMNNNVDINLSDADVHYNTSTDSLSLTGSAGYFVTNALEITGFGTYTETDFGDGNTDNLRIGAAADWHFRTTTDFVPYVGLGGAYGNVDIGSLNNEITSINEDDFVFQVRAGIKQFVRDNIAVKYQIEWNQGDSTESLGASLGLATFF